MAWDKQNLITKYLDSGDALRFLNVCATSVDEDRDCLWDEQEYKLADRFAPYIFMDEDEDCGIAYGWGPQVRFQVRPIAPDAAYTVHDWQPNDGKLKAVRITYFMNWPLDCGTGFRHAGRHLGDSENFSYLIFTVDMNEFVLLSSTHNYHSDSSVRTGMTLRRNADLTSFDRSSPPDRTNTPHGGGEGYLMMTAQDRKTARSTTASARTGSTTRKPTWQ